MFSLVNSSSIFQGCQLTPFAPRSRRQWLYGAQEWYELSLFPVTFGAVFQCRDFGIENAAGIRYCGIAILSWIGLGQVQRHCDGFVLNDSVMLKWVDCVSRVSLYDRLGSVKR